MPDPNPIPAACVYPAAASALGHCCGDTPCSLEWIRECDTHGGCWDRGTCGGCDEPVFKQDKDPVIAQHLAFHLHSDQTDKRGEPYVKHLTAVVEILTRRWPDAPPFAIAAAWLHDSMEDQGATNESLKAKGISEEAIVIVKQVSKPGDVVYLQWIRDLAENGSEWSLKVKLADNEHHRDPSRALPGSNLVENRYNPARDILEEALERRFAVKSGYSNPPIELH
jgi:hypothetical protein